MKYSEFKAEVEKLGFEVEENPNTVVAFRKSDGSIIGKVYKKTTACLDTKWSSFALLKDNEKNKLLDLFARLAKTPLAEREEEKRYYLRLATKIDVYEDRRYLNMDIPNEKYTLSENKDDAYYKAIFTESEISQLDITGFQKVEVEE